MINVLTGGDLPRKLDDLVGKRKPTQLYVRGDVACLDMPSVGIIGSRGCSPYGRRQARLFAQALAEQGMVIVSGLARGIDGEAHRGALDAGGRTVAVLGCGIDRDYPAAHSDLAKRIEHETTNDSRLGVNGHQQGAIVSEYEPGVQPAPWRFPARNRIVAALSDVVLLIEARKDSGSLITCDFASELDRTILAIPGDIAEGSQGSNELIRTGDARLVLSPQDVIGWLESLHLLSEYTS